MSPPDAHNRCLQCGYILDGLAAGRCPECGRVFDWADQTTYDNPAHRRPRSAAAFWIPALATAHLLVLAVFTYDVALRIPGERYPLFRDTRHDYSGMFLALSSPLVLLGCAIASRYIWLGAVDLLLGIIWCASFVRLLSQL